MKHGSSLPGDRSCSRLWTQHFALASPQQARFDPNVQKKTYWVPSLRRKVTLNVSAKGIKVIDARGIDAVVAEIIARGEKI